jgi:hypothetical protein
LTTEAPLRRPRWRGDGLALGLVLQSFPALTHRLSRIAQSQAQKILTGFCPATAPRDVTPATGYANVRRNIG